MLRFRFAIWSFAVVLVAQALWLLSAELVRPDIPYFPDAQAANTVARQRAWTERAASVGFVRGDLWTEDAIALAAGVIAELQGSAAANQPAILEGARETALWAARLSPHDARAWLVLAAVGWRLDRPDRELAAALKMSYFTGPGEAALVPVRLRLATRSNAIADEELQDLVTQDIRATVTHGPELEREMTSAYRGASPPGRKFIETALEKLDPNLLRTLKELR
jgi:hypothetical protein